MKVAIATLLAALLAAAAAHAAGPAYHVVEEIHGPDGGWDYLRIDPAGNRLLVTRGGSVMSVDLASKAVTPGLWPGARLHIALPIDGGAVLVTNGGSNTATIVDAKSGALLATIPTGQGPDAAGFDARSGIAVVVDHAGGDVVLIDAKARKPLATITVGGTLEEVALDGRGKAFVNVEDKNELVAIDLKARKVLGRYPLTGCDGPTGLTYDGADNLLFAACNGSTDVVDATSGKVVSTVTTGKGADGVVWDGRRKLAFVSAGGDGTLSILAVRGGKAELVQTLPTHRGARTLALDERTGFIYLPAADYTPASGGGRPGVTPGTFRVIVVAP